MKKVKFFALMFLAGATLFTSCKKDDSLPASPTISFANNVSSFEIDYATMVNPYTVTITPTVTADGEISTFTVKKKDATGASSTITVTGSFSGKTTFTETFNLSIDSASSFPLQIIFNVTDKSDQGMEKIFTITRKTGSSGNPIYTFTPTPLGAQNASEGSFFASVAGTGTVYSQSQAAANAANIYITYGVIGTTPNILSLPERANNGFTAVTGGPTVYYKASSITTTQFDAMTDDLGFSNITASTTPKIAVTAGNVYEFVNGTKKGLIKVTAITAGTSGNMTMVVKVQQ